MKLEISEIYDKQGELEGYQIYDSITGDSLYFVDATEPLNGRSILESIVNIINAVNGKK